MAQNLIPLEDLNPLQRAFNSFIMGLPPSDLQELLEFARRNEENIFAQNNFLQKTHDVLTAMNPAVNGHSQDDIAPIGRARTSRAKGLRERKLRPLNSFIAYRSYYSTMFSDMTQKSKSGIIKFLWQHDPFKAKWAILAKSYSIIRDKHGSDVSLDTFLNLTVPFIGLIEPPDYLDTMSWWIAMDDHQYNVVRNTSVEPDFSNTATNYSVADVVNYCYETDYVRDDHRFEEIEAGPFVTFAAQPNFTLNADNSVVALGDADTVITEDEAESIDGTPELEERPAELLHVHDGHHTQGEFYTEIDDAIGDLRHENEDDEELFAAFNPAM